MTSNLASLSNSNYLYVLGWDICIMVVLRLLFLARYYSGARIKVDERGMYGEEKKCMQGFGGKTSRQTALQVLGAEESIVRRRILEIQEWKLWM
jgi:hypothetical protein